MKTAAKTSPSIDKAKLGQIAADVKGAVNRGEVKLGDLIADAKGVRNQLMKTSWKEGLKGAAKGAAIEGVWEENIEAAITDFDAEQAINGNLSDWKSDAVGYLGGLLDNFTKKDGLKAIVLGSVLSRGINGQAAFFPSLGASALLVFVGGLSMGGYVALAVFIVRQISWLAIIGGTVYLLMQFADDFFTSVFSGDGPIGRVHRARAALLFETVQALG